MKFFRIIVFILLVFCLKSYAQIKPGAKQIALSHSDVAYANDAFAIFNNPAGLAQQNWREFSIYYSPSPFGLKQLANNSAVYHEPTYFGSLAIAYSNYGFELYKENSFLVSYSTNISKNIFLGTTFAYRNLSIKNYGSDNTLTILLGGIAFLTPDFRFGFAIDNITHSTFGNSDNQIPMIFDLGLSYSLLSKLVINASIEKEIDNNASLRVGIDYEIIKYLNLRIGAMNEPSSFSAGIGVNYSLFEIEYAVFNHQDLGFTHQFGITLQFGSDKSRNERIKDYLSEK